MPNRFDVSTTDGDTTEILAEYYLIEDDFVTFKTADHKQVASFGVPSTRAVVCRARDIRP